jgi:phage shock protein C
MLDQNQTSSPTRRLYRSKTNRMIGGVCGGLAEYFNIDTVIVRILWLFFTFFGGMGIIAYIVCLMIIHENPKQEITHRNPQNFSIIIGAGLILLGLSFLFSNLRWHNFYFGPYQWNPFHPWLFSWNRLWPVIIILAGVLYIFHVIKTQQHPQELSDSKPLSETGINTKKFRRSRKEKMVGGVCGGLAEYFNIDPSLMRVFWILITMLSGFLFGIILYIVLIIIIPEEGFSN